MTDLPLSPDRRCVGGRHGLCARHRVRLSGIVAILCLALAGPVSSRAQSPITGTITGRVLDGSTKRPLPSVNVAVHGIADSAIVTGAVTDSSGTIDIPRVPAGDFFLTCTIIGFRSHSTRPFTIDDRHRHLNVGDVTLTPAAVRMDEIVISADKLMYNNGFDRKTYNVDQDMMSRAASVSELLQNVPSVTVDIDGNVSLRGSSNVLIMVDGKSSALMDKNSAIVLEQMPASSIEKIEVMTNPSAQYKPDAASGIINIITKKNAAPGLNGDAGGNLGNQGRANANLRLNYRPGDANFYANYAIRKDTRNRFTVDDRRQIDSSSVATLYGQTTASYASPLSHLVSAGIEYHPGEADAVELAASFMHNSFTRRDTNTQLLSTPDDRVLNAYVRRRMDDEYEKEYGITASFEHVFAAAGHKLRLEAGFSRSPEQEDNHYTNVYSVPAGPNAFDDILITNDDKRSQVTLAYANPLTGQSTLQAGYSGEFNNSTFAFDVANFDAGTNRFVNDAGRTNTFLYDEYINAAWVTYKRSMGKFGFEAGMRAEEAATRGTLVTLDSTVMRNLFNIYPSLHMSYALTPMTEIQLSYSRRIHRPETEDLNPFPEYRDPRNYTSGNPNTLPEYTHQIELGFQYQDKQFSVLPALYYRNTQNRFTTLTRAVNDTLLVTSRGNLASDRSGGLELVLSADIGGIFTANWNGNAFAEQIDAANLGYGDKKSATSWSSVLTIGAAVTPTSHLQVNARYQSTRLTPQGEFTPVHVFNGGFRQDFLENRLSLVVTVADIFKTMRRELRLATPLLNRNSLNTRDAQIIYLGLTYHFGLPARKSRDEELHYDDNL